MKKTFKNWIPQKHLVLVAAVASFAAMSAGCGKQAYVVTSSQAQQQAPGSFKVPPKIDVLIVQDDTGSSRPIFASISSQLDGFLSTLQGEGWDYHLATIPLTSYRAINQVQASVYDPNWGSAWQAPYPGAQTSHIETVSAGSFRTPGQYTDFLSGANTSTALQGAEPGLSNLYTMLSDSSMTSTGFLRPDAMLAIVLLSTGDDTTGRNYCSGNYAQVDGWEGPCDLISLAKNGSNPSIVCGHAGANASPYCNNYQSSMQPYENYIANYKGAGNSNKIRIYPVVSNEHRVTGLACMGTNAFLGQRYQDLANFVGGQSFDICTTPIPNVLDSIAQNLSTIQLNFYTSYLFIAQNPDPTSIVVWRNPGGDASQRVQIPQDANNGWTYAGYVSNVFTTSIGSPTAPASLNQGSGYAVQLHGSGLIGGTDTATVDFKPNGSQNSAAQ